jgi:hypothetical protein
MELAQHFSSAAATNYDKLSGLNNVNVLFYSNSVT